MMSIVNHRKLSSQTHTDESTATARQSDRTQQEAVCLDAECDACARATIDVSIEVCSTDLPQKSAASFERVFVSIDPFFYSYTCPYLIMAFATQQNGFRTSVQSSRTAPFRSGPTPPRRVARVVTTATQVTHESHRLCELSGVLWNPNGPTLHVLRSSRCIEPRCRIPKRSVAVHSIHQEPYLTVSNVFECLNGRGSPDRESASHEFDQDTGTACGKDRVVRLAAVGGKIW